MRTLLPWALAALVASPSLVHAQAAPDYEAAKRHYQSAEAAMERGEFQVAAKEYGIAYDITKDPVLFFKLGSAFQKAGDCPSALAYFRRYLAEGKPDEAFRGRAEQEIATCEQQGQAGQGQGGAAQGGTDPGAGQATGAGDATAPADGAAAPTDGAAAATAPATGQAPPSFLDQPVTWQRTAAWTSVGVSLALVTAGAVLGLSARSREEDVENLIDFRNAEGDPAAFTGATRERYEDLIDEGEDLERLSIIAFSAAGAAAIAATVFFLIDDRATAEAAPAAAPVAIQPTVGPDALGVQAGWRF